MARNKYPEETVKKILDVSEELFLENGYDNTTIQTIIDNLGGLTKGVIYHHFKSKKDIFNHVLERKYGKEVAIQFDQLDGLNGFQKIKRLSSLTMEALEHQRLVYSARTLINNPQMVGMQYKEAFEKAIPMMKTYVAEGVSDGSIVTDYPAELAEFIIISTNIWLAPLLYEITREDLLNKLHFLQLIYSNMDFPLIDDAYIEACLKMHDIVKRIEK